MSSSYPFYGFDPTVAAAGFKLPTLIYQRKPLVIENVTSNGTPAAVMVHASSMVSPPGRPKQVIKILYGGPAPIIITEPKVVGFTPVDGAVVKVLASGIPIDSDLKVVYTEQDD